MSDIEKDAGGEIFGRLAGLISRPFVGAAKSQAVNNSVVSGITRHVNQPIENALHRSGVRNAISKAYQVGTTPVPGPLGRKVIPGIGQPYMPHPEQRRAYGNWRADDIVHTVANNPEMAIMGPATAAISPMMAAFPTGSTYMGAKALAGRALGVKKLASYMDSFANELEKRAGRWAEMSDMSRRALMGGGAGALLGAGVGALANKEDRVKGGLMGALGGGALGAIAGGLHGRFRPSEPGPTSIWAQALDNTSPDYASSTKTRDTAQDIVRRVSNTSKYSKPSHEYKGHKIRRTGRHYIAEMDLGHRDVIGRQAPVIIHGTWRPGWSKDAVLREALKFSGQVPKGHTKTAAVDPYQQQTQWTCSAACLKAVMAHHKKKVPELTVIKAVGAKKGRGAECDQIATAARTFGFGAFEYSFDSIDQARILLDQDLPIICDIQSFNNPGKGHYVVMVAANDTHVELMDPNTPGNWRIISRKEMEARWWDRAMAPPHDVMMHWGIIVVPEDSGEAP